MLAVLLALTSFGQVAPVAPKARPQETFLKWLARITGISATSGSLKGDLIQLTGDIWISRIGRAGAQRLTFRGGYSWPVFSAEDKTIIAVGADQLWSIPVDGGEPAKLPQSPSGIVGLVGTGPDGIVVFTEKVIGLFVPGTGSFIPFTPATKEEQEAVARMRLPARSYGNELTVKQVGTGIVIEKSGKTDEITPDGEREGEPSVSHDRAHIVYIRASK
jgi:hypothetical protein